MKKKMNFIRKISFSTSNNLHRHVQTPLLESEARLESEYQINVHEIQKRKRSITETVPVHIGLFVYQTSKLIFFEFVIDLFHCLREKSFKICYCDTDSLLLALTEKNFDDLVKPSMTGEWMAVKKKWFADSSVRSQKKPGLLKYEFESNSGLYIGLRKGLILES